MQLADRIDFMELISVSGANPNGDPAKLGTPRTDSRGFGVISSVCIRRKLRDRLSEMGECILVSPSGARGDVIARRASALAPGRDYTARACEKWYDVRAFGQVFAFPELHAPGVKGAVTIQQTYSVLPVKITEMKITRCIRNTDDRRGTQMGSINFVEHGLYVVKGSVNAYSAQKTGFSAEDAEKLRLALLRMFDNDSSAARPAGAMEVERLYWWRHSSMSGEYSSGRVFRTVEIKADCADPRCFDDYTITHSALPGLVPEIYGR